MLIKSSCGWMVRMPTPTPSVVNAVQMSTARGQPFPCRLVAANQSHKHARTEGIRTALQDSVRIVIRIAMPGRKISEVREQAESPVVKRTIPL